MSYKQKKRLYNIKMNHKYVDDDDNNDDKKPIKKIKNKKENKKEDKKRDKKRDNKEEENEEEEEDEKINTKKTRMELFKSISEYDEKTNMSKIVDVDDFEDIYSPLKLGNGGSWCRRSAVRPYKLVTIKGNGKITQSWDPTDEEIKNIEKIVDKHSKKINFNKDCGPKIKYIFIYGLLDKNNNRPIRKDIGEYYKKQPCVSCGSKSDLVCDHKNDLYNDPRVLNSKTQTLDDFQSLCNHCNLQKRQIMKNTLKTNKRYGATNIPMLKPFNIDFTDGDETFDKNDIDAMKGTYWYDPIDFMEYISKKISKNK